MIGNIRIAGKVPREAVIVNTMPMEHIEFGGKHGVKELLESFHLVKSS
jgi:hypothetical protein